MHKRRRARVQVQVEAPRAEVQTTPAKRRLRKPTAKAAVVPAGAEATDGSAGTAVVENQAQASTEGVGRQKRQRAKATDVVLEEETELVQPQEQPSGVYPLSSFT